MPLGAPDVDRVAVISRSGGIESGRGNGLPSSRIIYPGHYVIPAQRAGFLGADADQQAQRDVRVPPSGLCRGQQGLGLVEREALGRPPAAASRRLDQGRHVTPDKIVRLSVPYGPL